MAVVKTNGYRHGFIPITKAAEAGANWFSVARPRITVKMRENGIQSNLMTLGYICPERLLEMIHLDVSITIWTQEHFSLTEKAASRAGKKARVHLLLQSRHGPAYDPIKWNPNRQIGDEVVLNGIQGRKGSPQVISRRPGTQSIMK